MAPVVIRISQNWVGSGNHHDYSSYYYPDTGTLEFTEVAEARNQQTATSTFSLSHNITYPTVLDIFSADTLISAQTYTVKLGNVTRTGSLQDASVGDWLFYSTKLALPNLTYSVQHKGPISVPYSLSYSATVKVDQNTTYPVNPNYKTFTVTVTYSGYFYSEGFVKTYGSVGGVSKKIKKLYCSVNGKSRRITKLYGSVNGKSKRIF